MKYQVFFSLKTKKKYLKLSSAAVVIGALSVKSTQFYVNCLLQKTINIAQLYKIKLHSSSLH